MFCFPTANKTAQIDTVVAVATSVKGTNNNIKIKIKTAVRTRTVVMASIETKGTNQAKRTY